MIEALIAGKLHGKPERRDAKSGRQFVIATVRSPMGEDAVFINVVAFSEAVQTALLALDAGEAVTMSGALTVKVWTDHNGNARPNLSLVANAVLTVHHAKRKRDAMLGPRDELPAHRRPAGGAGDELDDGGPDPWLAGEGAR